MMSSLSSLACNLLLESRVWYKQVLRKCQAHSEKECPFAPALFPAGLEEPGSNMLYYNSAHTKLLTAV